MRNRQKGSVLMTKNLTYKEYEKKLCACYDDSFLTEEKVNELFEELISILPNNGKLYKYKALKTFHIDELEERYVWFSSAKNLNDKKDCSQFPHPPAVIMVSVPSSVGAYGRTLWRA